MREAAGSIVPIERRERPPRGHSLRCAARATSRFCRPYRAIPGTRIFLTISTPGDSAHQHYISVAERCLYSTQHSYPLGGILIDYTVSPYNFENATCSVVTRVARTLISPEQRECLTSATIEVAPGVGKLGSAAAVDHAVASAEQRLGYRAKTEGINLSQHRRRSCLY